jgi:hypothetical protein
MEATLCPYKVWGNGIADGITGIATPAGKPSPWPAGATKAAAWLNRKSLATLMAILAAILSISAEILGINANPVLFKVGMPGFAFSKIRGRQASLEVVGYGGAFEDVDEVMGPNLVQG